MPSLKDLAGDAKPVIAYPKTIQFGPVEIDGYMLENGEFRQSIKSTGRVMGMLSNAQIQTQPPGLLRRPSQTPVIAMVLLSKRWKIRPTQSIVPVRCPGVQGYGNWPTPSTFPWWWRSGSTLL